MSHQSHHHCFLKYYSTLSIQPLFHRHAWQEPETYQNTLVTSGMMGLLGRELCTGVYEHYYTVEQQNNTPRLRRASKEQTAIFLNRRTGGTRHHRGTSTSARGRSFARPDTG